MTEPLHSATRRKLLVCLGLACLVLLVYGRIGGHHHLHFDDADYVFDNLTVRAGLTWHGLHNAFFGGEDFAYWHPVTWVSHMLDVELWGRSPGPMLLTNAALHLAASVLFFLALARATGRVWTSAFAAAVFAAHPLNVESVAWLAERKAVLSGALAMLTLYLYVRHAQSPRAGAYLAVLAAFAVGMGAKPSLAPLPVALLALDYWPLGRFGYGADAAGPGAPTAPARRLLLEKAPLLAVSLAVTAVVILSRQDVSLGGGVSTSASFALRVENALVSLVRYVGKFVWPEGLTVFSPYPASIPAWQWAGAGALALGAAWGAWRVRRRHPWLAFGLAWFVIMLAPVSGLVQTGLWPAMADRFAYLPMVGFCVIAAFGGRVLLAHWPARRAGALAGLVVAYFTLFAWAQTAVWANGVALFENAVRLHPDDPVANHHLGMAYMNSWRFGEAIEQFDTATRLAPNYVQPWKMRSQALMRHERYDEAARSLHRAKLLKPDDPDIDVWLAGVYEQAGQPERALARYDTVLSRDPHDAAALAASALLLEDQGRHTQADRRFSRALEQGPLPGRMLVGAGDAAAGTGDWERAETLYRRARTVSPKDSGARRGLARVLRGKGDTATAQALEAEADRIDEQDTTVLVEMGRELLDSGRPRDAAHHFREALTITPGHPGAQHALDRARKAAQDG